MINKRGVLHCEGAKRLFFEGAGEMYGRLFYSAIQSQAASIWVMSKCFVLMDGR